MTRSKHRIYFKVKYARKQGNLVVKPYKRQRNRNDSQTATPTNKIMICSETAPTNNYELETATAKIMWQLTSG